MGVKLQIRRPPGPERLGMISLGVRLLRIQLRQRPGLRFKPGDPRIARLQQGLVGRIAFDRVGADINHMQRPVARAKAPQERRRCHGALCIHRFLALHRSAKYSHDIPPGTGSPDAPFKADRHQRLRLHGELHRQGLQDLAAEAVDH